MIISLTRPLCVPLTLTAAPMTLEAFRQDLLDIKAVSDRSQATQLEPFPTVKARLETLLKQAESSEEIQSACPEYVFAQALSVHSHRDIYSWVTRLLSKLEGHSMPPSQHDATLAHYMGELSPEAAALVGQSARRVSDAPGPTKKKK